MKKYLFANWKMYLDVAESVALARAFKNLKQSSEISTAVFPSALAATSVVAALQGSAIAVGAQNVYFVDKGGVTGEISAAMFQATGCEFALVGHSERRHLFGETNHVVRQKIDAVVTTKIIPVLCIGETKEQRDKNETAEVLEAQIRSAFTDVAWPAGRDFIIAYEPVWAIGTGAACEPEEAERIAGLVASWTTALMGPEFALIILYGGSVRPDNVSAYINQTHISGVLVGAASTHEDSWQAILEAL